MIGLLAAFQFLTIFPPLVKRAFTARELGRSTAFYPIVGLAVGGVLFGLGRGLEFILPETLNTAILLAVWVILSRALHFDGFLDTVDGLFGGYTPDHRLEIMRDSRVGAFGVAGGILLLLIKFTSIYSLPDLFPGLLLAPIMGRWAITMAIVFFPYARERGLGRDIKDNAKWPQAVIATLSALGFGWLTAQWSGIAASALAMAVMLGWLDFVRKRIPGLTGDIYGATCELVELSVLIFLSLTFIA
jgi:adenosylcobinamide-GDP ribazoletransferase